MDEACGKVPYKTSSTKSESLRDVVKEWNECKIGQYMVEDLNYWVFILNQKLKEIKPEYEKDEAMLKADILSGLPKEYDKLSY